MEPLCRLGDEITLDFAGRPDLQSKLVLERLSPLTQLATINGRL